MSTEDPEKMAARLLRFRHRDEDPPTGVTINGIKIVITEDSRVVEIAAQIRRARGE